ncbi:MAG: 16S rRNA (cytosine(1402)-N(4))-methyltransferase RsmH [Clostridia bacterium]|nr:16S rRNA (cytosine(1402)-N(4))-methyltransferase RsmH [Clostridia bacterium]
MEFKHISVLFNETIDSLCLKDGGIYVDGTLGGGGHSYGMLSRGYDIRLIGIDQDKEAIEAAKERLFEYSEKVTFVNDNFSNIESILTRLGIDAIDGAVLDLGVSSYQLDNAQRGFSYMHDARLDMRMNSESSLSAYEVVNNYSYDELVRIFYEYGEENWSTRIAKFIVDKREDKPVETTFELVELIKAAIPQKARQQGSHPAKRIFQAIRIEVNNELGILTDTVSDIVRFLKPGGRIAVITFHSLEDRLIKKAFSKLATGCVCPKSFPVCVCNNQPVVSVITKKPILPSKEEEISNSRSKSAKLRVAEKL